MPRVWLCHFERFLTEEEQKQLDLDTLISQSFTVFGITNSEGYTFQSLSQIAEIVDIHGAHTRNYFGTDLFFEKHHGDFRRLLLQLLILNLLSASPCPYP